MRLRTFSVEGLFGLFNHTIDLRLDARITVIHAPNGYGKTVVLKLIDGFFGKSFSIFGATEFSRMCFTFDDESYIIITRNLTVQKGKGDSEAPISPFTVEYFKGGKIVEKWNDTLGHKKYAKEGLSATALDRFIPYLFRVGPEEFRDSRSGETLSLVEAVETYSEYLPREFRERVAPPKWLHEIRASIHCQLIETQRLVTLQKRDRKYEQETALIPVVKTYSDDLVSLIERTLADSATLSSSLDRTFPIRLLTRLREGELPLSEAALRSRLGDLEQRRGRLAIVGLLDKSDDSAIIPIEKLNAPKCPN
jgi:hypothetical protein